MPVPQTLLERMDKVCEKNDHDSGVFPAKSPCEVNAAGIAHVDVQECKIIGRKVFDRVGIAERIKVRRDAAFFAMSRSNAETCSTTAGSSSQISKFNRQPPSG